jgi:catechol 2,3-dioxygenase-like lactoylglutathione lyase family enzyme
MTNHSKAKFGDQPRHQRILQEAGPAAGKITGLNHIVLFTADMEEGVRFYRDILGFRVVRTQRFTTTGAGLRATAQHSGGNAVEHDEDASASAVTIEVQQVFFEMGNGSLFSLYEAPRMKENPDAPISSVLWPTEAKKNWAKPVLPQKMDHLAFDVRSHEEVVWFKRHLEASDVVVSEVAERRGATSSHRFISSIYFSDPTGNALEISSFDAASPGWEGYDYSSWFMDVEPPEACLDPAGEPVQALTPNWSPFK